ncbi:MAG: hypothetical protein HKM05_07305 [Spirochaetales bacterium]|nr:hypothetical protein [Spirochaetales bacterium]
MRLRFLFAALLALSGGFSTLSAQNLPPLTDPNTYRIVWIVDPVAAQKYLDQVLGRSGQPPVLLTRIFRLQLSGTYQTVDLQPTPQGLWVAERILPLKAPDLALPPTLFRLVPVAGAGPEAKRLCQVLQRQWAADSPFPAIVEAPAFDQPGLDPRYDKTTRTLTIRFPGD